MKTEDVLLLVIVVLAVIGVVVTLIFSLEKDEDDKEDNIPAQSEINVQAFNIFNYPCLPGNTRDFTVPYPSIFNNNPRFMSIEVAQTPYTVAPPIAIISGGITKAFFELSYFRNSVFNFTSTPFNKTVSERFIGTNSLPFDSVNNVGAWTTVKCTNLSMSVSTATLLKNIDELDFSSPKVIANLPFDDLVSATTPIKLISPKICAWTVQTTNNKFIIEVVDASNPIIKRIILGAESDFKPVSIVGTNNSLQGIRAIVAFPSSVEASFQNLTTGIYNTKTVWTPNSVNETCIGAAWSQNSSFYRVILSLKNSVTNEFSFVLIEHSISSADNVWAIIGNSLRAPENNGHDTVVNAYNDLKLGEFFIYSSFQNNIQITRIAIGWTLSVTNTFQTSEDMNEEVTIGNAQLFGFNRSPGIMYSTSNSESNLSLFGVMSFGNTLTELKELNLLSNAREEQRSESIDISISNLMGLDSLILKTEIDAEGSAGDTTSFLMFGTINATVLAVL